MPGAVNNPFWLPLGSLLMKTPIRFLMLVLCIFIAAALIIAPSWEEWLAVLQDEGKQDRIIALIEPRLARDPYNPRLLATLAHSYAKNRAYGRAIELMKRYIALRPRDGDSYAQLADLYKKIGNLTEQIAMLKESLGIKPTISRVLQLAALYRGAQRAKEELALLSDFERDLTVASGSVLRLAELRNGVGDRGGAIEALMRPEVLSDETGSTHQAEARLYLAKLLLEAGRGVEAVRLGKQWISQWHEAWLASRLLRSAALHASVADASQLADAVVDLHPGIRLFLVHELAAMGAYPVARHLLETWADANLSPSMNEIAAFLAGCREQDVPAIAWQAFGTVLAHGRSEEVVTRFVKAFAANFGIGALAPFWASLPRTIVEHNPLLAAQLAFHEGNLKMTNSLLMKVDLASLSAPDRRAWIELLTATTSPSTAFAILRERRSSGSLPSDLLAQYARLAGGLGREKDLRAVLAELKRKLTRH